MAGLSSRRVAPPAPTVPIEVVKYLRNIERCILVQGQSHQHLRHSRRVPDCRGVQEILAHRLGEHRRGSRGLCENCQWSIAVLGRVLKGDGKGSTVQPYRSVAYIG